MRVDFLQPVATIAGDFRGNIPEKQTLASNGYDLRASLTNEKGEPRVVECRSALNRVALLTARSTPLFTERVSITLQPHYRALVPTGFWTKFPEFVDAQIRPRSGLAWKHGITILNAPGTVDPDFEGEWHLILQNHSDEPFEILDGDRLAQVVFGSVLRVAAHELDTPVPGMDTWNPNAFVVKATRGTGGYGSTGA